MSEEDLILRLVEIKEEIVSSLEEEENKYFSEDEDW